jgi:hypothetical protein
MCHLSLRTRHALESGDFSRFANTEDVEALRKLVADLVESNVAQFGPVQRLREVLPSEREPYDEDPLGPAVQESLRRIIEERLSDDDSIKRSVDSVCSQQRYRPRSKYHPMRNDPKKPTQMDPEMLVDCDIDADPSQNVNRNERDEAVLNAIKDRCNTPQSKQMLALTGSCFLTLPCREVAAITGLNKTNVNQEQRRIKRNLCNGARLDRYRTSVLSDDLDDPRGYQRRQLDAQDARARPNSETNDTEY